MTAQCCAICGKEVGFMGQIKLSDGNFICKDCEKKVSSYFEPAECTVEQYKGSIKQNEDEERSKVSKYLITLQTMRLIEKKVPCGESIDSRKGIYVITDNFYKFWFRYEFTNNAYYEMLGVDTATKEIMEDISNFMGDAFERICVEYLVRRAKAGKLDFIPYKMGKWWGNNPYIKAQDDVDILLVDRSGKKALFVECKFTNKKMPHAEYEDLKTAMQMFSDIEDKKMMFISKSGFEDSVIRHAKEDGSILLGMDDLFSPWL